MQARRSKGETIRWICEEVDRAVLLGFGWLKGGAEAHLQVRAVCRSEDDSADRSWAQLRPHARAVSGDRLAREITGGQP